MTDGRDGWERLASPFVKGAYATVKGKVRTFVVHEHLLRHPPAPPAAVLDVGGGAGHHRFADASASFEATTEQGVLGVPTRADTVEGLSRLLEAGGVGVEAWYGVWLFSDWLELAGMPASEEDLHEVAEVELEASRRDPYRQMSRLFHLVGRKPGT